MHTLGTHFEVLLENLQPPQERLAAARDLPPKVRDYLAKHKEFETVAPHSRLAGSYAQDMCVGDVKDVDILVRVPGEPEKNEPAAKDVVQSLYRALQAMPYALDLNGFAQMDDLELQRARRSVHVYFPEEDFHLDVVPCIAPDGFDQVVYVPDRGFNEWIRSHPIGYVKLLSELDQTYVGKVRRLGKLLKHFRNYQMRNRRPKSYWLGALLVHHVRREGGLDMAQPLAVLFRDLLDAIHRQYDHLLYTSTTATPNLADPLLGHNVSWNWARSHFETFMRRVDESREWATKALGENIDRDEAINYWQRVFGAEHFPVDVSEAVKRFAVAASPGHVHVTPQGLVVPSSAASSVTTLVPNTKFHGENDA